MKKTLIILILILFILNIFSLFNVYSYNSEKVITLKAIADTTIKKKYPSLNYGNRGHLWVASWGEMSFIMFSLKDLFFS